ncbi:MAG TPA: Na-translocating system protein MpsC family protein, partial [Solirubrobacteraceae bacterium]
LTDCTNRSIARPAQTVKSTVRLLRRRARSREAVTGRAHLVRETRKAFQDAMRDEMIRELEALTGRRVVAFMSDNHIDPDLAIECFQLAPDGDGAAH